MMNKLVELRAFADSEAAAKKLMEIAHSRPTKRLSATEPARDLHSKSFDNQPAKLRRMIRGAGPSSRDDLFGDSFR
jgi:hypothetical protein